MTKTDALKRTEFDSIEIVHVNEREVRAVGCRAALNATPKIGMGRNEKAAIESLVRANYKDVCYRVQQRAKHRCESCGNFGPMQHHHCVFRSAGGPDAFWNLTLLCGVCHERVHRDRGFRDRLREAAEARRRLPLLPPGTAATSQ